MTASPPPAWPAIACLTWWAGVAVVGVLLLTPAGWQLSAAVALAGAASGGLLRSTAAADRRAEQREQARRWAAIRYDPVPAAAPHRPRPVLSAWLVAGLAASSAAAAPVLLASHGAQVGPALVVVVGGSIGVWLLTLLLAGRRARRQRPSRADIG